MLDILSSKPISICLWGISNILKDGYLDYIKEAGFEIDLVIDSYNYNKKFCEYDVISPLQFKEKTINTKEDVYVIVTAISDDYEVYLKKVVSEALSLKINNNIKFLHPVFLTKYLKIDLGNLPFVCSHSGSGSILTKSILQELITCKETDQNNKRLSLFRKLSKNHLEILSDTLINIYSNVDTRIFWTGRGFLSTLFNFTDRDQYITFYLRSFMHLSEKIPSFHTIVDDEIANYLEYNNYTTVGIFRHPLDVIVSNAFKVHRPIFESLEQSSDIDVKKFKSDFSNCRIYNLEWFKNYATIIKDYYNALLDRKNNIIIIKYEKLLQQDINYIMNIANTLDISISKDKIKTIFEKFLFKPLAGKDKAHYNNPGYGKWKNFLDSRHIKILKELGYEELLSNMGYSDTLHDFNAYENKAPVSIETNFNENITKSVLLHDYHYKLLFNQKITKWSDRKLFYDKTENYEYATDSNEYNLLFQNIEKNRYIRNILLSGAIHK